MILSVKNISKRFGEHIALNSVSFNIAKGEFFSLLGPSGCGKTTLLRIIAGLEIPNSGSIVLNGTNAIDLPPQKRNVGVVFQNYALFPNMTVFKNVAYGLEVRKLSKEEIKKRTGEVLEKVRISHKSDANVTALSGGEQQRVSLARALVTEPDLLLFDEPLSNLDYALRLEARNEIKRLQRDVGITAVYVTHDQSEALALSDRIAVMNLGIVLQTGTPRDVYFDPANIFVADFIGHSNFFTDSESQGLFGISISAGELLCVFPEELSLNSSDGSHGCTVADVQFSGAYVEYIIDLPGKAVKVRCNAGEDSHLFNIGDNVELCLKQSKPRVLKK